jgi:hypothetical protein
LAYRKAVDRIFQELDQELNLDFNGKIEDDLDRGSLDTRRQRLGLALEDAEVIEKEVQQPYLVRASQRSRYAKYFQTACKDGCLPNDRARRRLAEIRQNLSLGETDADWIEQQLIQKLNLTATPSTPVEPTASVETQLIARQEALCSSETGIDYTELRDLLAAGKWKEADQETAQRMCEVMGRQQEGWLRVEDIQQFPCADLRTIDQLWVKYSDGKFGFSVQKTIWEEEGRPTSSWKNWDRFCVRVGWKDRQPTRYVEYQELNFSLPNSPRGELPAVVVGYSSVLKGFREHVLFSRAQICEL